MAIKVPLHEMTYSKKLELFDALWDDLAQSEEELPSPDWHKELLDERRKLATEGKNPLVDWETAKKEIDAQIARERNS